MGVLFKGVESGTTRHAGDTEERGPGKVTGVCDLGAFEVGRGAGDDCV